MKLKVLGYIALATLCLSFFLSLKECGDKRAENAMLKGREAELMRMMEVNDKEAAKKIVGYEERIAELQGHIDSNETIIVANEGKDKELAERLLELKHAENALRDKDEVILNLRAQVETWQNRFSLAQDTISEQGKAIFSLKEQNALQVKITLEKDGQILSRDELLKVRAIRIAGLEAELKKERAWGAVKKYVALGALAYVAIDVATGFLR